MYTWEAVFLENLMFSVPFLVVWKNDDMFKSSRGQRSALTCQICCRFCWKNKEKCNFAHLLLAFSWGWYSCRIMEKSQTWSSCSSIEFSIAPSRCVTCLIHLLHQVLMGWTQSCLFWRNICRPLRTSELALFSKAGGGRQEMRLSRGLSRGNQLTWFPFNGRTQVFRQPLHMHTKPLWTWVTLRIEDPIQSFYIYGEDIWHVLESPEALQLLGIHRALCFFCFFLTDLYIEVPFLGLVFSRILL